ncbi:hypothetical protein [Cohnella candidum]|uniref:DNA-binding protein n=1 Tax=Cohnella candidum TaxID=2674991 RepID=A0A3G3JX93_9BACL|nr:hypothetical protein [Cohnella candidum]AYQ72477.1 hypothetical protein EAV92_07805 [Cohnella candidum]
MLSNHETNDFPRLAQPAIRALRNSGISDLQQLTRITEAELKQLHGIGPNAIKQLRDALEAKGLSFKDSE